MYYYHAGSIDGTAGRWSLVTRRTRVAAVREAVRIARQHGGRPVVEYWDRAHGLRPGDCDAVAGSDFVD